MFKTKGDSNMKARPCLPEDIVDINRRKEYTLISTDLLESVLTDVRLNAQTAKLWQILFNKARYNPNLEIKISYSYLGKMLGKSTRTIARYVELLQRSGYLVVTHNFDKNGGQRPSSISVRVPELSIEHAKKRKDRPTQNQSYTNETWIKKSEYPNPEDTVPVTPLIETPIDVTEMEVTDDSIIVLRETLATRSDDDLSEQSSYINKNDSIETIGDNVDETSSIHTNPSEILAPQQDKNDRGGYDINVIQKDSNQKEINKNNNNNNVVSISEVESKASKIQNLENEIEQLNKSLVEGNEKLLRTENHTLMYEQAKKNSKLEASLHLARITLERLQKEIKENKRQVQTAEKITSDHSFMLAKAGDRPLLPFTFKRLVKSLEGYGYKGSTLNSLINEVVFEVRFGSLINCNRTKNPLSIDNAVNIALKLVREKRWTTPVLLKQSAVNERGFNQ